MKVRCEYCHTMVDPREKNCPSCGSPLPAAEERRPAAPAKSKAPLLAGVLAVLTVALCLPLLFQAGRENSAKDVPTSSIGEDFNQVKNGTADAAAYRNVISYLLENGKPDDAYRYGAELLEQAPTAENGAWCVETFLTFDRRDLAARLAVAGDACAGTRALMPKVAEVPLAELMADSPLRQAMELIFARTASEITLEDLQSATYLSVGVTDFLTHGRTIGCGFDPEADPAKAVYVQVEDSGSAGDLGFVYFQGLHTLEVQDRHVSSADVLIPGLRELVLVGSGDVDLTGFARLTGLERLMVSGGEFRSLKGLDAFPALRRLTICDSGITDLSVLPAWKNITQLSLLDNDQLTGVASLAQMIQLEKLSLSGGSLTDLSPLSALGGLTSLSVQNTAIRDTGFLAGLTSLEELTLTGNEELGTVPELAVLTALHSLTLDSDEMFESQSDMQGLTALNTLKLKVSKKLTFLLPLAGVERLTIYSSASTMDLSPLAQFRALRSLSFRSGSSFYDASKTELTGLASLRGLPLEELDLSRKTFYGPIDPVFELKSLTYLNLSESSSEGTDYSRLANLSGLRELDLGGYRDMADTPPGPDEQYWSYKARDPAVFIDHLSALPGLERLSLAGCGAGDISALAALKNLEYLDLSGNDITDLTALSELRHLNYLNLSGNRIADDSPVAGREGLTVIR